MDKYTVDLDKVLNDFEYSELTTDNFNNSSGRHSYTAQTTSTYASSSKSKTGDARHSITNVFQSLNEYLNTDISGAPRVAKDNSPKDAYARNNSSYLQNFRLVKTDDSPVSSDNKNAKAAKPMVVTNEEIRSRHEALKENERLFSDGAVLISKNIFTSRCLETNESCDVQGGESQSFIDNVTEEATNVPDNINKRGEYVTTEDCDENVTTDCKDCMQPEGREDEAHLENASELRGSVDECLIPAKEDSAVSLEPESYNICNEAESNNICNEADDRRECVIDSIREAVDDTSSAIGGCETVLAVDTTKTIRNEVDDGTQEAVGFGDSFDVDESLLTKYLDDLEVEFESRGLDDEIASDRENSSNVSDKAKLDANATREAVDVSNVSNARNELVTSDGALVPSISTVSCDALAESNISGRSPEVYASTTVTDDHSSTLETGRDTSDVCKEGDENEEAEAGDCEENLGGAIESAVDVERARGEGGVARLSSVERPTSLELSDEHSEAAVKRQINLIGNPGSTPYNNVYISKELQSSERKEDSSDSSTSASPTFSEVSTDTVNSTDSTDTEPEDVRSRQQKTKLQHHHHRAKPKSRAADNIADNVAVSNDLDAVNGNITSESIKNGEVPEAVDAEPSDHASATAAERISEDCGDASAVVEEVSAGAAHQSGQETSDMAYWLGKQAPLWIPDSEALSCLHCDARFTVIKRRHHCRACGLVLCSKCCNLKYKLEYLDAEARVCSKCYAILNRDTNSSSGSEVSPSGGNSPHRQQANQPNPNNPMEYCSVVPPLQQVSSLNQQNPPTVMVPVGVLKRKGSNKAKSNKSVMFCDGIRPGSDLTKLDTDFNYSVSKSAGSGSKKMAAAPGVVPKANRNLPPVDPVTKSFIPNKENTLPPTVTVFKSDITYTECSNKESVVEMLKNEKLTFAVQRNLHVHVKIVNMDCCINKKAWCFSTDGLISVGQDEVVYLIELVENEKAVPVDVFHHINTLYNDAVKGTTVTEMGISLHSTTNFLDFKNHAGFLYIRPTFQCLQNIIRPSEPYLIGLLIHRWETPWAKIFPLRLMLRLGAEYRYYPSPIISTRHRDSLYVEIGHTIINLLADFRNFSYTLPNIRGLTIHMEDKNTTVTIPENRYDQVMKSLNNSSDHILAFGGNFSTKADSHLVCIQDTQGNNENAYTTHAINIHNKPRKVTGASFIVFNGALKSTSGLTAKSSIVEDGLMIQIPPEHMVQVRESLRNMKNHLIQCGCVNAPSDETVHIVWGEPDSNFNIGVTSPIDNQSLAGVPSIRVHNGKDFVCTSDSRLIRWTEVFILQNTDENSKTQDPVDISKIAESISKATCQALVKYLDLLSSNKFYKIGIRTTLHVENVSYSAGSNNIKLPPIYMKNLDNELIPVLHRITSNNLGENAITLELIFRILNT